MIIQRRKYLDKLISKRENGLIKIVTGIRRCGKSYLLFNLYADYLISTGVEEKNIIKLPLDEIANMKYRNPIELDKYIRELITDKEKKYYIFIDEIQLVSVVQNPYIEGVDSKIGFVDVLLGLMKIENVDIYVTGSNSKMLSSDILTEFKDRGDEVRIYPLCYSEYYKAVPEEEKKHAWREYFTYGGMPIVLSKKNHEDYEGTLKKGVSFSSCSITKKSAFTLTAGFDN